MSTLDFEWFIPQGTAGDGEESLVFVEITEFPDSWAGLESTCRARKESPLSWVANVLLPGGIKLCGIQSLHQGGNLGYH